MIADNVLARLPADERATLAEHLKAATVLKIQNVADYYFANYDDQAWSETAFPNVAPPWPVVWAKYKGPFAAHSGMLATFWEFKDPQDRSKLRDHLSGVAKSEESRNMISTAIDQAKWAGGVSIYDLSLPHGSPLVGVVWLFISPDGTVIPGSMMASPAPHVAAQLEPEPDGDPEVKLAGKLGYHFANVLLLALTFCHCKNVVVAPEMVPPKLAKKRAARHRAPITKTYTLNIGPVKQLLNHAGAGDGGDSLRKALHICRGHFAHYGPEYGKGLLFGKHEGMFWHPMMVRGAKSLGSIEKSYSVNPNAEG